MTLSEHHRTSHGWYGQPRCKAGRMLDPERTKVPSSAVSPELRATPGRGDAPPSTDDYASLQFVLWVAGGLRTSDHRYEREHEPVFEAAAL